MLPNSAPLRRARGKQPVVVPVQRFAVEAIVESLRAVAVNAQCAAEARVDRYVDQRHGGTEGIAANDRHLRPQVCPPCETSRMRLRTESESMANRGTQICAGPSGTGVPA